MMEKHVCKASFMQVSCKKDDGEGSGACMLSLFYASFMARSH
jgi:hypothetical protein